MMNSKNFWRRKSFLLVLFIVLLGVVIVTVSSILSSSQNAGFSGQLSVSAPFSGGNSQNGVVKLYPFASGMKKFDKINAFVQDGARTQRIDLYSVNTNPKRIYPDDSSLFKKAAVAMFDMSGSVTIAVNYPFEVKSAVLRPARAGMAARVSGKTVTFELRSWGQYSLEVNGDALDNDLLIFANPPAGEVPAGARVIRGRMDAQLDIASGETVYLAPGAVVSGPVTMGSGSKLLGRGILTQGGPPAINAVSRSDIEIDGISIFDPNNWVLQLLDSQKVKIHNVKIISSRNNGDGITIQSSHDIEISRCFIRSWDDSIVLKNYTANNTYNVNVKDTVLWTDLAQSLEIGFETNKSAVNVKPEIHDISFDHIDILHAFHKAPISIHNADNCNIYNIRYENIIVEDAQMGTLGTHGEGDGWPYLIDFGNGTSAQLNGAPEWTHNDGNRTINNVLVKDVWVLTGDKSAAGIRLLNVGRRGKSVMADVKLENIYEGKKAIDYSSEIQASGLSGQVTQTNQPYFHW
jgi:hypothetical protein